MRLVLLAFVFLNAIGLSAAVAASLNVASSRLGAVDVTVPRCTTAGLLVINNLSGSTVVSVTVSSIAAACGGATIQATVSNGSTNSSGSSTVPGGGGSVTVSLASAPTVTTNMQTEILMTGP
jgi:hypothetical protein